MPTKIFIVIFSLLSLVAKAQDDVDPIVEKRTEEVIVKAVKMLDLDDSQVEQFQELEMSFLQAKKARLKEAWKYTRTENFQYFRSQKDEFRKQVAALLSKSQMKKWYAFETKVEPFDI
jgi:hypothetical protein